MQGYDSKKRCNTKFVHNNQGESIFVPEKISTTSQSNPRLREIPYEATKFAAVILNSNYRKKLPASKSNYQININENYGNEIEIKLNDLIQRKRFSCTSITRQVVPLSTAKCP
jgi:hypothetical protein